MKKYNLDSKGFTLIELLVVITILVALTLLGTYKYFNIVEENKQNIDISNAKILAEAVSVAEATGKLKLDSTSKEVKFEDLKDILNKEVKPTSKKYSGTDGNGAFIIKVKKVGNDFETEITANGETLYPNIVKKDE